MAGNSITQSSFSAGELSPSMQGRVDFAKYYNGLRTCRNFIIRATGGVSNRPGTRFVGEVHDSSVKGRMIPFQFSTDQSYVLLFGDRIMRIAANTGAGPGMVIYPEDVVVPSYPVVAMTAAVQSGMMVVVPTTLTIANHTFVDGETVSISGVADGIDGARVITVIDNNTIGVPGLDLVHLGAWTGAGTVTSTRVVAGNIVEIITPFAAADLQKVRFAQCNDVVTFVHPSYPPMQLSRYSHWDWRWSHFTTTGGPFLDVNVDQTKTMIASATTGGVTIKASWDAYNGVQPGELLYLEQAPDSSTRQWEVQKAVNLGDVCKAGAHFYVCTVAGTTGTVQPVHLEGKQRDGNPGVEWEYLHSGSGIVKVTGVSDARNITATVVSTLPSGVAGGTTDLTISAVTAGNNYYNPGTGTMTLSPVKITTSSAHGFASGSIQTVYGVIGIPGANGTWTIDVVGATEFTLRNCYASGTYSGSGYVRTGTTSPPTYKWAFAAWSQAQGYPATVSFFDQRQIFAGTTGRPQTVNMSTTGGYNDFSVSFPILDTDGITFTLAGRERNEIKHVLELRSLLLLTSTGEWIVQGQNDVLTPSSINTKRQGYSGAADLAPLLIDAQAIFLQEKGSQVRSLGYNWQSDAYTGQELSILSRHLFDGHSISAWAYQRTPYGVIYAVRDDGVLLTLTYLPEQDVVGWSRHDTDGCYEDVCCISEGAEDAVYLTVRRTINGVDHRYVERVANRSFTNLKDAFFVDCGLSYNGAPQTTFHGLDHLEGKTVAILADGGVCDTRVVTEGAVTIGIAASTVHIGLPYTAQMETLDLASAQQEIKDKTKISPHISIICDQTSGLKAGPDMDHLIELKQRQFEPYGAAPGMLSGTVNMRIQNTWNKPGRITIAQNQPLPMTILAVIPEVTIGGI